MGLKWYQDDDGSTSSGRLAFLPTVYVGLVVILVSAVLACIEVGMGKSLGVAVALGGVGGAVIGLAFGFKGWQRRSEAQIYAADKSAVGTT